VLDCRLDFPRPRLADVPAATRAALDRLPALRELAAAGSMGPRQKVAVTAGSRGIANLAAIIRASCEYLAARGFEPVVLAAMGSHGGGTPGGQLDLLRSLGVTEETIGGFPIHSGVDTVLAGHTPDGQPAHTDRYAATGAQGILVINRVKPHTAFRGPTESGLLKMLAVGLGHQPGAAVVHSRGPARMCETIRAIAAVVLSALPVVGGLAVIENAHEETAEIVSLPAPDFLSGEEPLLARARMLLPRLPLDSADLLIVEQIGKELSGTGMDTNVTGRWGSSDPGPAAGPSPEFRRVIVLDLTPASHGNATGIGLADFTTDRVVAALDRRATYTNCLTSMLLDRARLPLFLPDDRQALAAAVLSLGPSDPRQVGLVQIQDTLHLERIRMSRHLIGRLKPPPGVGIEADAPDLARPLAFDPGGNLDRLAARSAQMP
jgi:hypothetical protein